MKYGYARVSSKGQAADGTSLDSQVDTLKSKGCEKIVREAYTGTCEHRPQLDKLLAQLESGDELYVTKMDRLARSLEDGIHILDSLDKRGVCVTVLNMGRLSGDPASRLLRNMLLAVAEFERDMIAERTAEGKARARRDPNWREGRPKVEVSLADFKKFYKKTNASECTVKQACRELEISRSTWYNLKKQLI